MAIPIKAKVSVDTTAFSAGVSRVKSKMQGLKKAVGTLGPAIAAAFSIGALNRIIDRFDRISKLAERFDTSAESIQRIGNAAELAGADIEIVVNALTRVTRKATDLNNVGLADAFKALGINQKEFIAANLETKLKLIADSFANAEDQGSAFRHLFTLLEDDAKNLIPLFRKGGDAIQEMMDQTSIASNEAVADIVKLKDEITKLEQETAAPLAALAAGISKAVQGLKVEATAGDILFKKAGAAKDIFGDLLKARLGLGDKSSDEILAELQKTFTDIDIKATTGLGGDIESNESRRAKAAEKDAAEKALAPTDMNDVNMKLFAAAFGENLFGAAARQVRIENAKLLEGNQEGLKIVTGALDNAKAARADERANLSVIADSMASIGGGGTAVSTANPQLKKMDKQITLLEDSLKALNIIKDKNEGGMK